MPTTGQHYFTLNTGAKIPAIGLGCWSGTTAEENESAFPWILSALKNGYRHLDTAHGYGTEGVVGRAVLQCGIPREEIFVTTKLPNNHHHKVAESLEESLNRSGLDYFDLYLVHFPQAFADEPGDDYRVVDTPSFNETYAEMEKLLATGKVKAIGVSNFSVKNLTKLLESAKVVPAANQCEMHPHQAQPELLPFCKEKGIIMTAYSPTGYAPVREDPTIIKLAEKYNVSPAQVALAWDIARETTAVPKSTDSKRQIGNLHELPSLTPEDVALISSLHKNVHYCQAPGPKERDGHKLCMGWTYEQMGW